MATLGDVHALLTRRCIVRGRLSLRLVLLLHLPAEMYALACTQLASSWKHTAYNFYCNWHMMCANNPQDFLAKQERK